MSCNCSEKSDIRCLPNDDTWNSCPEKFRTITFYIENNSIINGEQLYKLICHPNHVLAFINSAIIEKNQFIQKKLMKLFQIEQDDIWKIIELMEYKSIENDKLTSDTQTEIKEELDDFYDEFINYYEEYKLSIESFIDNLIDDLEKYNLADLSYLLTKCSNDLENPKNLVLSGLIYQSNNKIKKAVQFYKEAKNKDDAFSCYLLARLYDCGDGVPVDTIKACQLFCQYYDKIGELEEYVFDSCDRTTLVETIKYFINCKK
jgi:tetratricopeptide (TPR) repeat protein